MPALLDSAPPYSLRFGFCKLNLTSVCHGPQMVLDHLVIQRMDTSGRTVLGPGAATAAAKQMFGKVRAHGGGGFVSKSPWRLLILRLVDGMEHDYVNCK